MLCRTIAPGLRVSRIAASSSLLQGHPVTIVFSPTSRGHGSVSKRYQSTFTWPGGSRDSTQRLPVNYGVRVVPQQQAWVVERFGKARVLSAGLHFMIPVVDQIAYVHSLKEQTIPVPNQQAITKDNVTISIDGVLYVKIMDPEKASYGVTDAVFAVTQLAQTTMRSELGKMTLDKTFEEREHLNGAIVKQINEAAVAWGVQCLRYEIRDIVPPASVKSVMDMQAEAERRKRAQILDSEGEQQADMNIAGGLKRSAILRAEGEAEAIKLRAAATAESITRIAEAMKVPGGPAAVQLSVAEQYVAAFGNIAKEGNTILLPSSAADPSAMVAQALAVFQNIDVRSKTGAKNTDELEHGGPLQARDAHEGPAPVTPVWIQDKPSP